MKANLTHVIDGEADCEALDSHPPLRPPVFLHQGDDDGALVVVVLVVGVSQLDYILWVVPKRI